MINTWGRPPNRLLPDAAVSWLLAGKVRQNGYQSNGAHKSRHSHPNVHIHGVGTELRCHRSVLSDVLLLQQLEAKRNVVHAAHPAEARKDDVGETHANAKKYPIDVVLMYKQCVPPGGAQRSVNSLLCETPLAQEVLLGGLACNEGGCEDLNEIGARATTYRVSVLG